MRLEDWNVVSGEFGLFAGLLHFFFVTVFCAAKACFFLSFALAAAVCFCLEALLTDFGDLSPIRVGAVGFWGSRHGPRGTTNATG